MRLRILLPLLSVVAVAACDFLNPKDVDYRQQAITETNRREALWKALNIHDYDFRFNRNCSCSDKANQPVTIRVRNDNIARVLDSVGNEVTAQSGISWPTVDSLYLWTRQLLNNRAFSVSVVFDTLFEFPDSIVGTTSVGNRVEHFSGDFADLPPGTAALVAPANYRIGAPFSKSKRVTWRSR